MPRNICVRNKIYNQISYKSACPDPMQAILLENLLFNDKESQIKFIDKLSKGLLQIISNKEQMSRAVAKEAYFPISFGGFRGRVS